jgi:hypothetical protein
MYHNFEKVPIFSHLFCRRMLTILMLVCRDGNKAVLSDNL